MAEASLRLFISTVSVEFRSYRDTIADLIKGPLIEVKVQEDFIQLGGDTLEKLDHYIEHCDGVIHLVGDAVGAVPPKESVDELLHRHPDFATRVRIVAPLLAANQISYTQWEAYLAIYHHKKLFIFQPTVDAPRDAGFKRNAAVAKLQEEHLDRLRGLARYEATFINRERLGTLVMRALFSEKWSVQLGKWEKLPDISTPKLPYGHLTGELVGRDEELSELARAWDDDKKMIFILRAWGGVGKTALVAAWMAEMASLNWRGAAKVFDWSFYLQGTRPDGEEAQGASADAFFNEAMKFFGAPEPHPTSPQERGALLARLAGQQRTVLVLDGLEPLQYPPGNPREGQVKDPALATLLKSLARQNLGLCVVTTRERVSDLQTFYGKTVEDLLLSNLSEPAGAKLLVDLSVKGSEKELRAASREVKGHALTLQLMGRYLKYATTDADIRKRDVFKLTEADPAVQGNHASHVLVAYENWLRGDKEGRAQLAILRVLGLFDRPADPGCLQALRQGKPIAGLTDELVKLNEAQWNLSVNRLEELQLLTRVLWQSEPVRGYSEEQARARLEGKELYQTLPPPSEFRPSFHILESAYSLEVHPLVREHFARWVQGSLPNAWKQGHQRLFEHLQKSVPYWPEGLEGLAALYQAVSHGCHAGLEQEAYDLVFRRRILRGDEYYSTRSLGLLGPNLGALKFFFEQQWIQLWSGIAENDKSSVLNQAAFCLRGLGRLTEAVGPMRIGLEIAVKRKRWNDAADSANNLRALLLAMGNIEEASKIADESVEYASRASNQARYAYLRRGQANAQHFMGNRAMANELFQQAFAMESRSNLPGGSASYRYCELLLDRSERAAWQVTLKIAANDPNDFSQHFNDVFAQAKRMGDTAEQQNRILNLALARLTYGHAVFHQTILEGSALDRCQAPLELAVKLIRNSGRQQDIPSGLLIRAWWRHVMGNIDRAIGDIMEAWEIAELGPMKLAMADIHLTRARLFRDREELAKARELITACGYHRRDGELEDAEKALG